MVSLVIGSIIQFSSVFSSSVDSIGFMAKISLSFSSHFVALTIAFSWVENNCITASP